MRGALSDAHRGLRDRVVGEARSIGAGACWYRRLFAHKGLGYRLLLVLSMLMAWVVSPTREVYAQEGSSDLINQVAFEQKLDAQIRLDLTYRDETDQTVRLNQYFQPGKPVILLFAYYQCQMLCPVVLEDLTETLSNLNMDVGDQFHIIIVSMDPSETAVLAAQEKDEFITEYGRQGAKTGWHFLTGDEGSILSLADEIGMQYAYDEELGEYVHPTGLVLLTPQGRISRYIFGVDYTATDLRLGLVEASSGKIGNVIDQAFLLCYRYNPVTGRYSLLISKVIRTAAIATTLVLGTALLALFKWERREEHGDRTGETARQPSATHRNSQERL